MKKKYWLYVAAGALLVLWLVLRKKNASSSTLTGHVLDPSDSAALSTAFDQMNPGVPGTGAPSSGGQGA